MPNIRRPDRPSGAVSPLTPAPTVRVQGDSGVRLDRFDSDSGRLRYPAKPLPDGALPLAAGVGLIGDQLVIDGKSLPADKAKLAQAVYAIAERIDLLDTNPFTQRGVSAAERKSLQDTIEPLLTYGSSRNHQKSSYLRGRSGAFGALVLLAEAMSTKGEAKARASLIDTLQTSISNEKHGGYKNHAAMALEQLRPLMSKAQLAVQDGLLNLARPKSPPYDEWFGNQAKPELRARSYIMDEFWTKEIKAFKQAGFKVTEVPKKTAVATKTIPAKNGNPETTIKVEMFNRDYRVLEDMDDPNIHAVLYTGHADVGGVARFSLDHGPRDAFGTKFVGFLACRGKQWHSAVRRQFPDAQLLVSDDGTFGHDDRIVIQELLEGFANRRTYADIQNRAEAHGLWEKDNYFYPHDRRQGMHEDDDGDGVTDVTPAGRDLVYSVRTAGSRYESNSFQPARSTPDIRKLDGSKLKEAVSYFNSSFHYWMEDNDFVHPYHDRFVADGWFVSNNPDEIVRINEVKGRDGSPVVKISFNSAYGHQSTDALTMALTYEGARALAVVDGESKHNTRLRALSMVSAYMSTNVEYSDVGDELLAGFAKRFNFPPTLNYDLISRALAKDSKKDATQKIIDALNDELEYAFLEVNAKSTSKAWRDEIKKGLDRLAKSDNPIAKMTLEHIVNGSVKIDQIKDLTKADFGHLAKEFRDTGTDIDRDDFVRLQDGHFIRKLANEIDGYMWDNRIYLADGMKPEDIATTLVHEVNHIINRSEEHYRGPKNILIEEYRAHLAEKLYKGENPTAAERKALKEYVIKAYELKGVTAADVPDNPPGVILPKPTAVV